MGLFDRFKKRVEEVVDATDAESLSAQEGTSEAEQALKKAEENASIPKQAEHLQSAYDESGQDEDWEDDCEDLEELESSESSDDDWEDDWEDFDDEPAPVPLSKKELKRLNKQEKKRQKELKKRGAQEAIKPKGSKVQLSMMRTTTGRQLVEVSEAPRGSSKSAEIKMDSGAEIKVELGGGIVSEGGRVIKEGATLDNLLEELEWVMLESDISSDAVSAVSDALRNELVGSRLRRGADLAKVLEASLKRALRSILAAGYWDFDASIRKFVDQGDTPVVVMMVGVNGTGKTTTAAKLAKRIQDSGLSVIAAAGDTFRAGAIQQLETHCERLGIRCISSERGGDSAAIARDAVHSAQAKGIDVVLVDTAGRMQNKQNLMNELAKVRRVANPHLTLFVGDALAGNDAVDQAKMFQEMLKFDGAVLTKLDTDAKGGAALSVAFATGRPIVFAGVGQEYTDLMQFNPDWLLEQLFE